MPDLSITVTENGPLSVKGPFRLVDADGNEYEIGERKRVALLTVFFFAFLPQFVSSGDSQSFLRMLQLSAAFMLLTFVIFGIYGVFAAAVREQVLTRPRVLAWMRRVLPAPSSP